MKKCIRIMKASDLEGFRTAIFLLFSKPCFVILSIFIVIGHGLAYDLNLLSFSWNPSYTSAISGTIYLILLICSVLAHELGHISAAIYRGDSSSEAFIVFNSGLPSFATTQGKDYKPGNLQSPALSLAGIYFQLLFASFLGYVFLLTDYSPIPASVLLIDIGILASLAPTPGTDGHWFLVDLQRTNGLQKAGLKNRTGYISFALGINLNILYLISSFCLLLGTTYQLSSGILMGSALEGSLKPLEFLARIIFLIPIAVYVFWAILKARFLFPVIVNMTRGLHY
jgi:hypothetical protein